MKKIIGISILFCFIILQGAQLQAGTDPYMKLAKKLSRSAKQLKTGKVAIIPFTDMEDRSSDMGDVVAERLTTRIVDLGKLKVIERQLLKKVLGELQLETTGIIDDKTTKELGKILGVDAIVTGTILRVENNMLEINARVIRADTAEIVSSASAKISSRVQSATAAGPGGRRAPSGPAFTASPEGNGFFIEGLSGTYAPQFDIEFSNSAYPIDEVDMAFDIDGDGVLEHAVTFRSISFENLEMEQDGTPWGLRAGFFYKNIGLDFEISHTEAFIKKQDTKITINGTSATDFSFYVDDYLSVKTTSVITDLFVQADNDYFRPYLMGGLGIASNSVNSPYIYQYNSGVFSRPLEFSSPAVLFRAGIGLRLAFGASSPFIMAEHRISSVSFTYNRGIKNEVDTFTLSSDMTVFGVGYIF